jgi:predicted nucleic acid-binding protein
MNGKRVYPDTSVIVALHWRRDSKHEDACDWKDREAEVLPLWTPWHRVEVFNSLRQLAQAGAMREDDARRIISRLTYDLSFYYTHEERDWRDVLRAANEISADAAWRVRIRMVDLMHMAYALELGVDEFVTSDERQAVVSKAVGLKTLLL